MRVLHVIGPLSVGGAQTQLLGLVREAHGTRWDATVVATSGGPLVPEFEALGCPFVELRRRGSPGLLRIRAVRRLVSAGDFDVVHGNLWQSNLYCRLAVIGRATRPAVVISERNVEPSRSRSKRWLDRRLGAVTDTYVGNTEAVSEFIRAAHPHDGKRVVTIPNAVDRSIFTERAASRRSGPVRLGFVGRLDPEKGVEVLLQAAEQVSPDFDEGVEVLIAGTGRQEPDLRQRAAASGVKISFVGVLPTGPDVARFMQDLDVFVLPSLYREGRPNVILEAVATGLPVVTTATPGMSEIFGGDTLVPPGDIDAMAEAIREACRDPYTWTSRSRPVPVPDFPRLADEYRSVFEEAVARSGG